MQSKYSALFFSFSFYCSVCIPTVWAKSEPDTIPKQSSDYRAEKNYGVGLGFGSFIVPASGSGLLAHYNHSNEIQFELGLWSGSWDAKRLLDAIGSSTIDKFDVNFQLNQIRAKYFLGNSFYLAGGLGMRQIEFDLSAISGSTRIQENLKANTNVFSLAIGNTWCFDNGLFIGGEWMALSKALSSSVATHIRSEGVPTSDLISLQADALDTANTLAKATTIGLATFHIGWQF